MLGRAITIFPEGKSHSEPSMSELKTGAARGEVRQADLLTMMNELHRGKNVGEAWRAVIDIAGICEVLKDADIRSSTLEIIGSEDILKQSAA